MAIIGEEFASSVAGSGPDFPGYKKLITLALSSSVRVVVNPKQELNRAMTWPMQQNEVTE